MTAKKTTTKQDLEITELYKKRISPQIICKTHQISNSTLLKILKDNNVTLNLAKKLSNETKLEIANSYSSGNSAKEVGKKFNIAESTVFAICRKLNITVRQSKNIMSDFFNNQDKQDILALHKSNKSIKEISEIYNVDINTISKIIKNTKEIPINLINSKQNSTDLIDSKQNYGTDLIAKINGITISKQYILSLNINQKEQLAQDLFVYFRSNGFPYPIFTDSQLKNDWYNLLQINTCDYLEENIILASRKNIIAGAKIWKHFSKHYYEATTGNKLSMIEAFNSDKYLMKAIRNRLGITYKETFTINGNAIKQAFRVGYICSQVSVFNSTIAKLIYDKYTKPNDIVYDFSMGFGQRLLGAMVCKNNLTYIGVDPWSKVVPSLEKMAAFLEKSDKCSLNQTGAELFCPEELHEKIDFAFSSPPYYNIEIYEKDYSQANIGKTYDQFINEWWLSVAKNIHQLLKIDGKLALNMKKEILDDMQKVLLDNGFEYIETLFIRSSRKHMKNGQEYIDEPVAIFKKIK